MFCPECGTENKDDATFCQKCGYSFKTNTKKVKETTEEKASGWKGWSTPKKVGSIILILCIGLIVVALIAGGGTPDKNTELKVTDLAISPEGYGLYEVTCNIIPDKDYDYLQMTVVFYDSEDAIIDKSPLVWNMRGITTNQTIKVSGNAYISGDNTPAKGVVYIFDKSSLSTDDLDDAIYKQTIEM